MKLHQTFERLIDAFRPADGPPPRTLLAFFRWALSGAWGGLGVAAFASALSGAAEVASATLLGGVVDAVAQSGGRTLADHTWLIAGFAGFFLILRPAIMGLSAASSNVIIGPNILPLVLSRLHRWTMGHAVTFFDNDFAGRIAQKQMQTARAVHDQGALICVDAVALGAAPKDGPPHYFHGKDKVPGTLEPGNPAYELA